MLPSGIGLRNTVEAVSVKWVLDELLMVRIRSVRVPLPRGSARAGALITWLYRTGLARHKGIDGT